MILLIALFVFAVLVALISAKYYRSYRKTVKRLAELDFENQFFSIIIESVKIHQNYDLVLEFFIKYLKENLAITNILILTKDHNIGLLDSDVKCLDFVENNKHIFWQKLSSQNIIMQEYQEKSVFYEIFVIAFWEHNSEIIVIISKKGQIYPFGNDKMSFFEKLSSLVNILRLLERKNHTTYN